jgi:hypothetical protein
MVEHSTITHKGMRDANKAKPERATTRQQFLKLYLLPRRRELLDKAIELALNGDQIMLKFLLERLLPQKIQEEPLELGYAAQQVTRSVIEYVAEGELTADEAIKISLIAHKAAEIENQAIMINKLNALESKIDDTFQSDINIKPGLTENGQEVDPRSD